MESVLPRRWEVPGVFRERLGASAGRQRLMQAEGHTLVILHSVPNAEGERTGLFFWRSPEGQWKSTTEGPGLESLRAHWAAYEEAIAKHEASLDRSEGTTELFRVIRALGPVERSARNGAAVMQELRAALPTERAIIDVRDRAYEVAREAELVLGEARLALDYAIARHAESQSEHALKLAEVGHRLNLMAAVFLPVTALGSVFGMNLVSGLDETSPAVFWLLSFGGLGVGFALAMMLFRPGK